MSTSSISKRNEFMNISMLTTWSSCSSNNTWLINSRWSVRPVSNVVQIIMLTQWSTCRFTIWLRFNSFGRLDQFVAWQRRPCNQASVSTDHTCVHSRQARGPAVRLFLSASLHDGRTAWAQTCRSVPWQRLLENCMVHVLVYTRNLERYYIRHGLSNIKQKFTLYRPPQTNVLQ